MFGAQARRRDVSSGINFRMGHQKSAKIPTIPVKFQDLYGFSVEGNVDDVNVLNEVRERVRQQAKV